MGLKEYKKKRDFKQTREPRGKVIPRKSGAGLQFVIQKHDASRLHYDFRLELDGVLKSWAVPKGPSLDPSHKSLAVQVEDHPIDYGDFEGVIPDGNYGGGTVLLWDRGTWEPMGDAAAGLAAGKLHFVLQGEKLRGEFAIIRMHGRPGDGGKNWLLFKVKDQYASGADVLTKDKSVKTKRSLEQIAGDRDDVWSADAKKTAKLSNAKKSAWPKDFSPQLAVLAEHAPKGGQWLHEIKFDGYRILAYVKAGNVELLTRNGNDWTDKFGGIAKSLEKLDADSAIIDGEAVVLDADGRSDFQALQAMLKNKEKAQPVYYAFDLPFCNGVDLRDTPLIERKKKLKQILEGKKLPSNINYSDHVTGDGAAVQNRACSMALEGIISKLADSPYVSRRDPSWLKSKCDQRQEFVIIGYTDPQGGRTGFGALLLGYYDGKKQLTYAGRVGTGFDDKMLGDMHRQLKALAQKSPPTDIDPPARERRHAHWVSPKLVGEVRFTGWTRDGVLRHPAFIALRSDKKATAVVRERAVSPEKVEQLTPSPGISGEGGGAGSGSTGKKSRKEKKVAGRSAASKTTEKPSRTLTLPSPGVPGEGKGKKSSASAASEDGDTVAGVHLSHPDKVFYADNGVTKHDVAAYYEVAAEWMLPHVADRPLALVRCPNGAASKCFFQRNWSSTLPKAVGKVDVSHDKKKETHVMVTDLPGIVSLVQIGVLEIHTWNCHRGKIENPDQLIFDLDPGPGVSWKQIVEAARVLRKTLDNVGLPTFLKTSGGKGLHLTIPIEPNIDWDSGKGFCEAISKSLVEQSDLFVANMRKDLRNGKVYLDYHRNGRSATAVAPYSTRARDGAPVSMPISWEELGKLNSANHFTVETAGRYLEKRKTDPWKDFAGSRVDLRKIVQEQSAA